MCQPLPYADFQWVDDISNFNVMEIALDSPTDYILEYLEYPQHLHDAHTDLPFCPTRSKSPGRWEGRYGAEAMIAKPNFHSRSVFSENLVAIEMHKLEMKFNKPIYVGI